VSLKPPWKQKNPVMEKACQAYHKQTAPAKAVEILENLKAKDLRTGEVYTGKKVLLNGGWERWKVTLVSFTRLNNIPQVIARIEVRETDNVARMHIAKLMPHPCGIYYKGEQILKFSAGHTPYKTVGKGFTRKY